MFLIVHCLLFLSKYKVCLICCTCANVSSAFSIGDKVDLLQCGVKVGEGSIFNTNIGHKVHGRMVNKGSIVVNVEKVLKHDALLPHPIGFENTLGVHWDLIRFGQNKIWNLIVMII